jgi:hypothetical protein
VTQAIFAGPLLWLSEHLAMNFPAKKLPDVTMYSDAHKTNYCGFLM